MTDVTNVMEMTDMTDWMLTRFNQSHKTDGHRQSALLYCEGEEEEEEEGEINRKWGRREIK